MVNISTGTLMQVAALGGFATAGMGYALRYKLNKDIAATEYYQEAIDTLSNHAGALYILGKPIQFGAVDVSNTDDNWTKHLSARYEVPVRGTKQIGTLYFWAYKKNSDDKWSVNRIELGLKSEPNKRLLVKNVNIEDASEEIKAVHRK